jgi:hypothetical protein
VVACGSAAVAAAAAFLAAAAFPAAAGLLAAAALPTAGVVPATLAALLRGFVLWRWLLSSALLGCVCRCVTSVVIVAAMVGMRADELARLRPRLVEFTAQMLDGAVRRSDQRVKGELYVRGLLTDGARKSMQPMAQRLGVDHQQLQQFVTWRVQPVVATLRQWRLRWVGQWVG